MAVERPTIDARPSMPSSRLIALMQPSSQRTVSGMPNQPRSIVRAERGDAFRRSSRRRRRAGLRRAGRGVSAGAEPPVIVEASRRGRRCRLRRRPPWQARRGCRRCRTTPSREEARRSSPDRRPRRPKAARGPGEAYVSVGVIDDSDTVRNGSHRRSQDERRQERNKQWGGQSCHAFPVRPTACATTSSGRSVGRGESSSTVAFACQSQRGSGYTDLLEPSQPLLVRRFQSKGLKLLDQIEVVIGGGLVDRRGCWVALPAHAQNHFVGRLGEHFAAARHSTHHTAPSRASTTLASGRTPTTQWRDVAIDATKS